MLCIHLVIYRWTLKAGAGEHSLYGVQIIPNTTHTHTHTHACMHTHTHMHTHKYMILKRMYPFTGLDYWTLISFLDKFQCLFLSTLYKIDKYVAGFFG